MKRLVVLLVAGSLVLTLVPGASASQPCAGTQSNYFAGFDTHTLTTFGSMATLNTKAGAVCTGGAVGASAAWPMVADNTTTGHGGFAQSGYAAVTGNLTPRYFSQWRQTSGYTPTTVWGSNASGTVQYLTSYHFDTGHLYMQVGSQVYDSTNFDPAAGIWTSPWDSQFYGETFRPQDDMPGTAATHVTFSTIRYVSSRTSGWVSVPSGYASVTGSTRYHFSGNTATFDIWTDPLQ